MAQQKQNQTIVIHRRHWGIHRALSLPEHRVHSLFDELIREPWCCRQFTAAMDVMETPREYFVEVEVPGVLPEAIRIRVSGARLTIEGDKKLARPKGPFNTHLSERCEGSFFRSLQFPEEIDASRIDRFIRDGVLYLKIRKNAQQSNERNSS